MNKPDLWFRKTNLKTGISFEDRITSLNCIGWGKTPFDYLNITAQNRIDELNTKMPDEWRYELIGWRIA